MPACHVTNDIMGDHAISCAIGGERISKHNHVRDAIFKAAVEAGLGPVREPDGLLPGSDDRPADVLIPIWTEGRDTALDITVVNPLQQALVARASEEGDSAVEHAHKAKLRKYEERCDAEAITFLPLAVDTFGGCTRWAWPPSSSWASSLPGTWGRRRTRWYVTCVRGWGSSSSGTTP